MRSAITALTLTGLFSAAIAQSCNTSSEVVLLNSAAGIDSSDFCLAWNSATPTAQLTSPFAGLTPSQINVACACLIPQNQVCSTNDTVIKRLGATFKDATKMCTWFLSSGTSQPFASAFSTQQAIAACQCVIQNPALLRAPTSTPAATPLKISSTTTLSTAKLSTTTTTSATPISTASFFSRDFYMSIPSVANGLGVAYNNKVVQLGPHVANSATTIMTTALTLDSTPPAGTYTFKIRTANLATAALFSTPLNSATTSMITMNDALLDRQNYSILTSDTRFQNTMQWSLSSIGTDSGRVTMRGGAGNKPMTFLVCPGSVVGEPAASTFVFVTYDTAKTGCAAYPWLTVGFRPLSK
ncbi:hypothetical protein BDZ85DRAFT_265606 [Elsinoe ampelina]|uniref:Uncharacterized protein n=1 Tax=Elsinoe ampelina TaxID=302913 RepID=A0A6A6G7E1_9PEZI|nr:hypothetical protein BDZ85DRAFT_265606 [Elsinoe ampelina]